MTDLSDLLDTRMDERIMHAINDLDFDGFKSLISELLGGIGVKVTRMDASEDAVFFEGVSEDGKYFVVASRLFDNASIESMKVLKDMADKRDATPVLVVTCDLDDEEKKFAEAEGISYADKPKLLTLLRKYDLAGKMMAELDRTILEKDRNRYLPSGAQFDSFYNLAEEHFKQHRYRDAIYNYDRALDIKPNNDVVWLRKANVFLAMGRYEDALVACKRASELRPGDATTWYLMGLAYNQLGDYEKELKAYDTALKIQPRMEAALLNKGATLFQLRRYDWALKVYEDMCTYFPKDAMAFNNRGIVLKAMGRHKEALESFDRASFLNRNYIDPVVNRALTYAGMGLSNEAIEAWTEALQIDRERADIWFSLGMSQKTAGMLEEAVRSFDTAASLDSELTEAVEQRDEILATLSKAHPEPEPEVQEVVEPAPEEIPEMAGSEAVAMEPEKEEVTPVHAEMTAPEAQIPIAASGETAEAITSEEELAPSEPGSEVLEAEPVQAPQPTGNETLTPGPEQQEAAPVQTEATVPAAETPSPIEAVEPSITSEETPAETETPSVRSEEVPEPATMETEIPETEQAAPVRIEAQVPEEVHTAETAPIEPAPPVNSTEERAPSEPEPEVRETGTVQAPEPIGNETTVPEPEPEQATQVQMETQAPKEGQMEEPAPSEKVIAAVASEEEPAPSEPEPEVAIGAPEEKAEPAKVESTIPEPEPEQPVPVQIQVETPTEIEVRETASVEAVEPIITSQETPSEPEPEVLEFEPVQTPEPIGNEAETAEPEPEEVAPVQTDIHAPEEVQGAETSPERSTETLGGTEEEPAPPEPAPMTEAAIAPGEDVLSETTVETQPQALSAEETASPVEETGEIRTEEVTRTPSETETTTVNQEGVLSEASAEIQPLPAEEPVSSMEEAGEPIPAEEQPAMMQAEVEATAANPEDLLSEMPAETQAHPAEETVAAVEEVPEQTPFAVEGSALVPAQAEVALVLKESPTCGVQKVEGNVSVVPVEPSCLPAVCDEECKLALQGERGLPCLQEEAAAVLVKPQDVTSPACIPRENKVMVAPAAEITVVGPAPIVVVETLLPSAPEEKAVATRPAAESALSVIEAQTEVAVAPSAEVPAPEAPAVIVQPVPVPEIIPIPPEPVHEVPSEPEIPISDRELKAAVILNILGENARALEEIDRYIREKSGSHDARHVKANILDDLGRLPECLEELKEAIRLDPKDEVALMDIESISRRLGRKEESMRILATLTPSKEVKAREAVGLLEAKLYDEVISKYANLGPLDSLVSRMSLATALMAKARYRDAYRVLKEILLEHPAYPEALNNMGVCMRFMGEYGYDEPMHFMHLAVEADPNYADAWNNIGATLFVLGDYNGAMEAIRKAAAVDRRSEYLINLSKCQIMVGDIAGAKLSLTSALKYEETAEIDFALGLIAEKEGEMRWALKLYDSAIELHPGFKDAIFNRQRVKLFLKYTQK